MKNNKGITIVEMVVVVLILILLAIISVWSSKRTNVQAEATMIYSELNAMHKGVLKIRSEYNNEIIDAYTSGEHYNTQIVDSDNDVWYVIYGMGNDNYSEKIMNNLGIDEIKRDYKVNYDTAEVEFLNGPVKVDEYEINSYEDIKTLMESGVL